MSVYLVVGTQSSRKKANSIMVLKVWNLHKMQQEDDNDDDNNSDSDDSSDEDESKMPKMAVAKIKQSAAINRVRFTQQNDLNLVATWLETGTVSIWELSKQLEAVENETRLKEYVMENNTAIIVLCIRCRFT
uniref:Uncharacterized protein n=1 Tax=Cuerna arida TaxID=1464854 RepID=A0A1B6EUW4_9HEMI